ncbi:MAG: hypothetical protein HY869_20935 [Chloroflexi bacterium]|nr:hypothetical protein [Chloroflexota bacterium]
MSRSSIPRASHPVAHQRPPLPEALKKGAMALHHFDQDGESQEGTRGSSFALTTKIDTVKAAGGKKVERIYIYASYARTPKGREHVDDVLKSATKEDIPLNIGNRDGAFWFLVSLSKKALKKWQKALGLGALTVLVMYMLKLAIQHPEINDLLKIIFEHILS